MWHPPARSQLPYPAASTLTLPALSKHRASSKPQSLQHPRTYWYLTLHAHPHSRPQDGLQQAPVASPCRLVPHAHAHLHPLSCPRPSRDHPQDGLQQEFEAEAELAAAAAAAGGPGTAGAAALQQALDRGGVADRIGALREVCSYNLGAALFELIYHYQRKRMAQGVHDDLGFRGELLQRLGQGRMHYVHLIDQLIYFEDMQGLQAGLAS